MTTSQSKGIIIHGSSKAHGNTTYFTDELSKLLNYEVVQLLDFNIGHFDYEFKNASDDFLPLITRIIHEVDILVFASPVYWYSMSGHMKVFFDRITDLLMNHKELGRQLRNKKMAVLSVSDDNDVDQCFYEVFRLSARYLGMQYLGKCHAYSQGKNSQQLKLELESFANKILSE